MVDQVQVEGNITGAEAPPVETVQEDRPEWLPEKFNSPEDLSKAYSELEKQFTQSRQEAKEEPQTTEEPKVESTETPEDAKAAVENVGLDFEGMKQEYADNGKLSEETYKDLETKGIPKDMVDAYVAGQEAKAAAFTNEIYEIAGGEESYKEVSQWAAESLSEDEVDAFNGAVSSGNQTLAKLAVEGLMARYKGSGSAEPELLGGKASSSVETYTSWAQVTKDMGSAEYKKDPAFRKAVEAKLARSNNI